MKVPLLSICIPAYRAVALLGEALEGVRAQSFTSWELIVVEDGSDDGTRSLVEAFAASASQPVRYVRHPINRGLTATRNTGIREARTDWIAILDADDIWQADHLASMWTYAAAGDVDLVHGGSILFDHESRQHLSIRAPDTAAVDELPVSLFRSEYIIQPSSVLLSKQMSERVGGFDESFQHVEDREMWLRCTRAGARVRFTGKNTCLYRKHASAMSAQSAAMAVASARVFERHLDWDAIPVKLRTQFTADAWISAGRLLWRTDPGQAASCFERSCKIQFSLLWWIWGRAQWGRQWWAGKRRRGAAVAAAS